MRVIESYLPVYQQWGDNALCLKYVVYVPSRDKKSAVYGLNAHFYGYFVYYGEKVTPAMWALYSNIYKADLRELMTTYKTGRSV